MNKYEFNATRLIAEAFENHGIPFEVKAPPGLEAIVTGFPVDGGSAVTMLFISRDNDNDVAVRVPQLITNTPKAKRPRVMEACNILSLEVTHLKFDVDRSGNVNVEYDFPQHTPDEGVGEMAVELFVRMMEALDSHFGIFMKAIYTDEELDSESLMEKLERLSRMREARMNATGTSGDEESDGESDDAELNLADSDLAGSPNDTAC